MFVASTVEEFDSIVWGNAQRYDPRWVYHGCVVGSLSQALSCGGGTHVVSLDAGAAELEHLVPDPRSPDPEANYERVWRHTVLQHAVHALREHSLAQGRSADFHLFTDYDLLPEPVRPTYKDLAARYKIDEAEVKKRLLDMRDRLRREVRAELARVTMHDEAIDDEWTVLFGG